MVLVIDWPGGGHAPQFRARRRCLLCELEQPAGHWWHTLTLCVMYPVWAGDLRGWPDD